MMTEAAHTTVPPTGDESGRHGHKEVAVADPRPAVEPESLDRTPQSQLASDVLNVLVDRERARHHSELAQTREQILSLASSSAVALLSSLDDELAAVATAAIGAMSVLRRDLADPLTSSEVE